jgi:hypothetical protein
MINKKIDKLMTPWYELKPHPTQDLMRTALDRYIRFPVVCAGRRSGKTEIAKRLLVKYAMMNANVHLFAAAPTFNQVKRIYWKHLIELTAISMPMMRPSATDLVIFFNNGSTISLIGLDKPERMEGVEWAGGVVDEIADVHSNAWESSIYPSLTTYNPRKPDYKPWCYLIGVPSGMNHFYDLCQYARTSRDPEWEFYTWKSADILPADTIASAKRSMSAKQFRQEFEASFETVSGRVYEDYNEDNLTSETIKPHEALLWSHDFNFTPLSSCISVIRNDHVYSLDEIVLDSAVALQSAMEFVDRYKDHENKNVYIYGDPSGKVGEKHGHQSDYSIMQRYLRKHGWTIHHKVQNSHPAIKDRQNSVRSVIRTSDNKIYLHVNPNKCPYLHKGLMTVQIVKGSTFQEQDSEYQHITTALGYMMYVIYPPLGAMGYSRHVALY